MKTIVTLTRGYYKEITVEVNPKLLEGKSEEEIAGFLIDEYEVLNEEELFEKEEYEEMTIEEESNVDTDRFDIYDEDGNRTYGGHL